jgi:hypothetical protein
MWTCLTQVHLQLVWLLHYNWGKLNERMESTDKGKISTIQDIPFPIFQETTYKFHCDVRNTYKHSSLLHCGLPTK